MTTITHPPRRSNLFPTIMRLVFACTLLVAGAWFIMYAASFLFSGLATTEQATNTIECRRIQVRNDESVHFIDAIGVVTAPDQSLLWRKLSTEERQQALQWCRDNNQLVFNELY